MLQAQYDALSPAARELMHMNLPPGVNPFGASIDEIPVGVRVDGSLTIGASPAQAAFISKVLPSQPTSIRRAVKLELIRLFVVGNEERIRAAMTRSE